MKAFKLFSTSPPFEVIRGDPKSSEIIRGKKVARAGLTLHAPSIFSIQPFPTSRISPISAPGNLTAKIIKNANEYKGFTGSRVKMRYPLCLPCSALPC